MEKIPSGGDLARIALAIRNAEELVQAARA